MHTGKGRGSSDGRRGREVVESQLGIIPDTASWPRSLDLRVFMESARSETWTVLVIVTPLVLRCCGKILQDQ